MSLSSQFSSVRRAVVWSACSVVNAASSHVENVHQEIQQSLFSFLGNSTDSDDAQDSGSDSGGGGGLGAGGTAALACLGAVFVVGFAVIGRRYYQAQNTGEGRAQGGLRAIGFSRRGAGSGGDSWALRRDSHTSVVQLSSPSSSSALGDHLLPGAGGSGLTPHRADLE